MGGIRLSGRWGSVRGSGECVHMLWYESGIGGGGGMLCCCCFYCVLFYFPLSLYPNLDFSLPFYNLTPIRFRFQQLFEPPPPFPSTPLRLLSLYSLFRFKHFKHYNNNIHRHATTITLPPPPPPPQQRV